MQENVRDCYVKSSRKNKEAIKSGAGSSKARKYLYSDQLRFLSKLINERQTADSLLVENMEDSQVTKLFNRQNFSFKAHTNITHCNSQNFCRLNVVPHFTLMVLKTVLQSAMQLVEN
jgi:hypothetical protein